jgi:hypothetical protein
MIFDMRMGSEALAAEREDGGSGDAVKGVSFYRLIL